MSKHDKTLHKMSRTPTPTDITWDELAAALASLGYVQIKGSGSRRKFVDRTDNHCLSLHEPHPHHILKAYAVRQVIEALETVGKLN